MQNYSLKEEGAVCLQRLLTVVEFIRPDITHVPVSIVLASSSRNFSLINFLKLVSSEFEISHHLSDFTGTRHLCIYFYQGAIVGQKFYESALISSFGYDRNSQLT